MIIQTIGLVIIMQSFDIAQHSITNGHMHLEKEVISSALRIEKMSF